MNNIYDQMSNHIFGKDYNELSAEECEELALSTIVTRIGDEIVGYYVIDEIPEGSV